MANIDPFLNKLIASSRGTFSPAQSFIDGTREKAYASASSKLFHKYDKDYTTKLTKITALVEKLSQDGSVFADIKDCEVLKNDNLSAFTGKQLDKIHDYLCKCNQLAINYESKSKKLGSSPAGYILLNKLGAEIDGYKTILADLSQYLVDASAINVFNVNSCAETIDALGLNITSTRDMEVVRALEFTGITLERDENGLWQISEKATSENTHGLPRINEHGEQTNFTLDHEQVQSFLKNYLNVPSEDRNGAVVTAEGIFKLYLQEAFQGISKDEKTAISAEIADAEKLYSTESAVWQEFKNSTDHNLRVDAVKLALVNLYKDNLHEPTDEMTSKDALGATDSSKHMFTKSRDKLLDLAGSINELAGEERDNLSNFVRADSEYQNQIDSIRLDLQQEGISEATRKVLREELKDLRRAQFTLRGVAETAYAVASEISSKGTSLDSKKQSIQSTLQSLGTCEFLHVIEDKTGNFVLEIDSSSQEFVQLPDNLKTSLVNYIETVYNSSKDKTSAENVASQKNAQTEEKQANQSDNEKTADENLDENMPSGDNPDSMLEEEELMQFTDESMLRLFMERGTNLAYCKNLERLANLDRVKFLSERDNEFTRGMAQIIKANPDLTLDELTEVIRANGLETDLFTPEAMYAILENHSSASDKTKANAKAVSQSIIDDATKSCVVYKRAQDKINQMLKNGEVGIAEVTSSAFLDKILAECDKSCAPDVQPITEEEKINARKAYANEFALQSDLSTSESLTKDPNNANKEFAKQLYARNKEKIKEYAENHPQVEKQDGQDLSDEGNEASNIEVTIKKFKELYPKFDDKGMIKKFKSISGKMIDKTIENMLKSIENVVVTKTNTVSSSNSTPPSKNNDNAQSNFNQTTVDNRTAQTTDNATNTSSEQSKRESAEKKDIPDYEVAQYAILGNLISRLVHSKNEQESSKLNEEQKKNLGTIMTACDHALYSALDNPKLSNFGNIVRQIINDKMIKGEMSDEIKEKYIHAVEDLAESIEDPNKKEAMKKQYLQDFEDLKNIPQDVITPIFINNSAIDQEAGKVLNGKCLEESMRMEDIERISTSVKTDWHHQYETVKEVIDKYPQLHINIDAAINMSLGKYKTQEQSNDKASTDDKTSTDEKVSKDNLNAEEEKSHQEPTEEEDKNKLLEELAKHLRSATGGVPQDQGPKETDDGMGAM